MTANVDSLIRKGFAKAAAAALALLALNVLLYLFGIARLGAVTESQKQAIETNGQKINELQGRREATAGMVSVYREGSKALDALGTGYFKTRAERFALLQKEIQKLLEANGLSNDSVSYTYGQEPKENEKAAWRHRYVTVQIPLAVSGSYPQIKKFIADLQASPQFLIVDAISLSASSQGTVLLNARIGLSTLFLADQENATAAKETKTLKKEAP